MGVNSFEYFGEKLFDISEDTVTEDVLPVGVTAHDANGDPITGKRVFVDSVNGKTGTVELNWENVGADKYGTATEAVSTHNTNTEAHNDLRIELTRLKDIVNDLLDSEDPDLDELHEIVAYIKSNKTLIDAITTSKVNVADIINNLVTNKENMPLSAAQGVVLKGLIDGLSSGKLDASALSTAINTALAQAKASGEFDGAPGTPGANGIGISDSEINADGELVLYYTDGNEQNVGRVKGEDGVLTAEQEELLETLKAWYDKENYTSLAFKDGSISPTYTNTTLEMRPSTRAYSVTFSWQFNKTPTSLTVGGTSTATGTTSYTKSFYSTTEGSQVFSVVGKYNGDYGEEEAKRDWTFLFRNKVYYGAKSGDSITATEILNLTYSKFATDYKNTGFNLGDSSADKYIWYCFPYRFEDETKGKTAPTFTLGGYQGGFIRIGTVSFTNSSGYTEDYSVYRSTNKGVAKANVTVT